MSHARQSPDSQWRLPQKLAPQKTEPPPRVDFCALRLDLSSVSIESGARTEHRAGEEHAYLAATLEDGLDRIALEAA
jgi:hypothetical protein